MPLARSAGALVYITEYTIGAIKSGRGGPTSISSAYVQEIRDAALLEMSKNPNAKIVLVNADEYECMRHLLKNTLDILHQCNEGFRVQNVMEVSTHDGSDDGTSLMCDIEHYFEENE